MRGVRVAFLTGDGSGVHDAAIAVLQQIGDDSAAAEEDAIQVHIHHGIPFGGGEFPGLLVHTGDTGVVDENIDLAKGVGSGLGGGFDADGVSELDGGGVDLAELTEGLRGFAKGVGITIPKTDGGAGLKEALRDGVADATSATGDDGVAAFEVDLIHGQEVRGGSVGRQGGMRGFQTHGYRRIRRGTEDEGR